MKEMEATKYVWEGAIPLQIHLHESEVTVLPQPPPVHILAPRIGYLPLLLPLIKPFLSAALPPVLDSVWFDYNGLPLKWYIPTGVLFDLLCPQPERPWNLMVHFRGYPSNLLIPCEGEESVKWSFINSLKEADYIMNGNCKNVMQMSQSDQLELWNSVKCGNMDMYIRISSKLKLGPVEDEYTTKTDLSLKYQKIISDPIVDGKVKTGKVPIRLYVYNVDENFEDLEDIEKLNDWGKLSYVNRIIEIQRGKCFTLHDALTMLLPSCMVNGKAHSLPKGSDSSRYNLKGKEEQESEIKLVIRVQGIEPKMEIPFSWIVNNFKNPDHFLHLCLFIKFHKADAEPL